MALLHAKFGARITQWLLTLRKQNAAVVLATQSPTQLAQVATRHAVLDSCPTKIYLPNPEATSPVAAEMYRDLGLNEREIATIAAATPKRDYYLRSPRGSRLFELSLGPVALAFLAAAPGRTVEESKRRLEALIDHGGPTWPADWLDRCGLPAWAASLRVALTGAPPPDGSPDIPGVPPPFPLPSGVTSHVSSVDAAGSLASSHGRTAARNGGA